MSNTKKINGEAVVSLFAELAEKEQKKATKRKATKKADVVEKAEITEKAEKPKTVKKATKKATEKPVEKKSDVKSQSTEKPKKVVKKAPKSVEKTAEKEPKKTTKKAKAEVEQAKEQEQKIRPLTTIKVAKTEYILDDTIKSYDDLEKAVVDEKDIYVAFDISEVDPKEYENIFHTPFEKSMKEKFDICTPIFVGEKNRRLVFASIYTEALWDLFPDEFELLSAVLIEKPKKAKK